MNKITTILIAFFMLSLIAGFASAATLNLVTKNPSTWAETPDASVLMTYNEEGANFYYTLVGNVPTKVPYSLIYYKDQPNRFVDWGLVGVVIADNIVPDVNGRIVVSGSKDIGTIPQDGDVNVDGGKIWMVPTANVHVATDGVTLVPDWNPSAYLFEANLRVDGVEQIATSQLISYTKTNSNGVLNAAIGICAEPTVGIVVPDSISFGMLYAGGSKTTDLDVIVTEYVSDENCGSKLMTATVSIIPGAWNVAGITTGNVASQEVEVETTAIASFDLTATVDANVVPGSYTQTITVDAVY